MNLELIRKYLPEFNSYVKGQPLTLGYKTHWGTYEWTDLVWADWDSSINEHIIIINDEYLPYRKALAEGKTVQYMNSNGEIKSLDDWDNIGWKKFKGCVENYRIKPKEPEFKIGDYVRYIHANSPKPLQIVNINYERYYFENAEIILRLDEIEKWKPREGEVCIFWEEDGEYNRAIIGTLKEILSNGNYVIDYGSGYTVTYSNCMPFTGILPPHMKD